AIGSTAHPMIDIGERHTTNAMLACQCHRACHRLPGVEIARTALSIPALERAITLHEFRLRMNIHQPVLDCANKSRKTIQTMGIDSVTCGLDKQLCTTPTTFFRKPELQQNAQQCIQQLVM